MRRRTSSPPVPQPPVALTGPTGTFSAAPALTPLEVATGTPWGLSPGSVPLRVTRRALSPVEALEQVLVTALERPPCLVSFSGGRDSSGLLALAARVSRQRGLDLPIPATLVFPADAAANEDEWQQVVLKELDLPDWARVEVAAGELDAVAPVAAKAPGAPRAALAVQHAFPCPDHGARVGWQRCHGLWRRRVGAGQRRLPGGAPPYPPATGGEMGHSGRYRPRGRAATSAGGGLPGPLRRPHAVVDPGRQTPGP